MNHSPLTLTPSASRRYHRVRTLAAITIMALSSMFIATSCGSSGGGGGGITVVAPSGLVFSDAPGYYRVGEAIPPNTPTVQGSTPTYAVQPALPAGLTIDPLTGVITGTPTNPTPTTAYTITATNGAGSTDFNLMLGVGPALPAEFASLLPGFIAEEVISGQSSIVKIALAPDGRIFFSIFTSGEIRVIDVGGTLLPTPFATIPIVTGGHRGLLGLTLDPDFTNNGYLYAMACVAAEAGPPALPDRQKIIRFTDTNNVGTNETTVIDSLPITPPGDLNNGGDIVFDSTGALFVSIGDVQSPTDAQADSSTSLAGKVLRYDVSTVPAVPAAGNPNAGDPEWLRGLRNTFALAVHPVTGELYGGDNGGDNAPYTSEDILGYFAPGKNFGWGTTNQIPGSIAGFAMWTTPDVTVPTGLIWHTGNVWGADYADDIFMTAYDDSTIIRFETSASQGSPALVNVDRESVFAEIMGSDLPIDIEHDAVTGDLYLATQGAIYRISKQQ